jgi:hypothetical protein
MKGMQNNGVLLNVIQGLDPSGVLNDLISRDMATEY